jgi:repressor LexA
MVGAGILDGDYVIAHHQPTAGHGDIVVACIGDEAVVKRLRQRHGEWWLEPENPTYEALSFTGNAVTIQGKVIALHRWIDKTGA